MLKGYIPRPDTKGSTELLWVGSYSPRLSKIQIEMLKDGGQ